MYISRKSIIILLIVILLQVIITYYRMENWRQARYLQEYQSYPILWYSSPRFSGGSFEANDANVDMANSRGSRTARR